MPRFSPEIAKKITADAIVVKYVRIERNLYTGHNHRQITLEMEDDGIVGEPDDAGLLLSYATGKIYAMGKSDTLKVGNDPEQKAITADLITQETNGEITGEVK